MKVVVVTDSRVFQHCPDGTVWTRSAYAYPYWARYLDAFEQVCVVARSLRAADVPPGSRRVDGEGVLFSPVPYYVGPWQYALRAHGIRNAAGRAVGTQSAIILRLPSQIAAAMAPVLRKAQHPYGAEVTADPYLTYAPGAVRHPLRPFLRWWVPRELRQQCAGACAVSYVTREVLQRRYPPSPHAFATHYSNVHLGSEAFISSPRLPRSQEGPFRLVTVAYLNQPRKGVDVLIRAVAQCLQEGLDLRLAVIGDGTCLPELQRESAALGLTEQVRFYGELPAGAAVREQLDQADLFILASRAEGLPRAMLEAMARGLPCIGSTLECMAELLDPEELVPFGEPAALAAKIRAVLSDGQRMANLSRRNLVRAREYREQLLGQRRGAFHRYVRDRTEEWDRANRVA